MKWTKELPTVPGLYFVKTRHSKDREISRFREINGVMNFNYQGFTRTLQQLSPRDGWQFSGPIPEPED